MPNLGRAAAEQDGPRWPAFGHVPLLFVELRDAPAPDRGGGDKAAGGGLMQVKVMVFDDGDGDGDGDRSVNYDRRCRNEDTTTSGKVIKNRL